MLLYTKNPAAKADVKKALVQFKGFKLCKMLKTGDFF